MIAISDKTYWHHYIPFYETFFKDREISTIAEIGILKGLQSDGYSKDFLEGKYTALIY